MNGYILVGFVPLDAQAWAYRTLSQFAFPPTKKLAHTKLSTTPTERKSFQLAKPPTGPKTPSKPPPPPAAPTTRRTPAALAMPRELQCVPSRGRLSRVRATTASIRASSMVRGAPDRGSSRRPSRQCSAKRCHHLRTVIRCTPSLAPICGQLPPSLAASTIRARSAKPCAVRRRLAKPSNSARSASVNTTGFKRGLPIPLLRQRWSSLASGKR